MERSAVEMVCTVGGGSRVGNDGLGVGGVVLLATALAVAGCGDSNGGGGGPPDGDVRDTSADTASPEDTARDGGDADAPRDTEEPVDASDAEMDGDVDTAVPPPPDTDRDVSEIGDDATGGRKDTSDSGSSTVTCCLPDDSCARTTGSDCGRRGGVRALEFESCSAVDCTTYTPEFACCSNGTCSEKSRSDCNSDGGTLRLDRRCSAVVCSGETARPCCITGVSTGVCQMLTQTDCQTLNGTVESGADCTEISSCGGETSLSACCTRRGCQATTDSTCTRGGGTFFRGDACVNKECP